MLDQLPKEIQIEILSRLPIKVLVRCACVSKSLFSLLTSQTFIDAHMKQTDLNHFFLEYYSVGTMRTRFFQQPDDESFDGGFSELGEIRMECDFGSFSLVASVNGVICLYSSSYNQVVLWNPSIRKCLIVPDPEGDIYWTVGFGFDRLTNDYKLICLQYFETYFTLDCDIPPKFEVYSVNSRLWRPGKGSGPVCRVLLAERSQCLFNGVLHWPRPGSLDRCVIVTFGMHDEIFGKIMMPDSLADDGLVSTNLRLDICRDMLALITVCDKLKSCSIWVMKEYGAVDSWTQIFNLNLPNFVAMPMPFGFRHNKEVIILAGLRFHMHVLLLVDQNGVVIKGLRNSFKDLSSFSLETYVESLALFKEGKATRRILMKNRKRRFRTCKGLDSE